MSVMWKSFLSKIGLSWKITRILQVRLKRSPKYLHLENINQKDVEFPYSKEWTKVKQELVAEVVGVQHNPGFMVTDSNYFIKDLDLLSSGPITIHKIERGDFLVFKEKWSRTELDEIVAGCDCCAILSWMLPNIDRMLTEEEVQEFYTINDSIYEFERARKPLDCNQILNKINDLEAIGCFSDGGNSILWTNPSTPEKLDSVVKNLKKLCLELQVKLEEA